MDPDLPAFRTEPPRLPSHGERRRGWLRQGLTLAGWATASLPLGSALAGLTACSRKALTVGLHPWPGYALLQLAQERGWLSPGSIQLQIGADATATQQALRRGQLDAVTLTLDEVLQLRSEGLALQVVAVLDVSVGADALMGLARIGSLSELKGRRIGVEAGTLSSLMLAHLLRAANLERADVQPVTLRQDDMLDALRVGRVDAAISYEPHISRMEALGYRRLFDSRSLPNLIMDVLAVRPERARHDALLSLVQGHFRARDAWLQLPMDAAISLSRYLGVRSDQVRALYRGLNLPGPEANRAMLQPGAAVEQAALQLGHIMERDAGWAAMPEARRLESLCNDRYLPSVS